MPIEPSALVSIDAVRALVPVLLPAALASHGKRGFYRRIWTPVVVVWAMIFQRLNTDHSCEAAVQYVRQGGADHLDTPHAQPLSQRLHSLSTAAYCQARARLPLAVVQTALAHVGQQIASWLQPQHTWYGHPVVLMDGSQLLLRPSAALQAAYPSHSNQHGPTYWLGMRLLAAVCLGSGAVLAAAESALTVSEQALVPALCAQLPADVVWVADRNFGVYSVVQAIRQYQQHIVVRLNRRIARALVGRPLPTASDCRVAWGHSRRSAAAAGWPDLPIAGRVIHVYLVRTGFRTIDLYLFTTLLDATRYPWPAVVELYGQRWQVELRLRDIKSTLGLELLTAKSPEMARKELFAGLLAHNLVRGCLTRAALLLGTPPLALSFSRCRRWLLAFCLSCPWIGGPQYLQLRLAQLLHDLAQLRLPPRPAWRIEPRAVRRRPAVFPNLKGSRSAARVQARIDLQADAKS